MVSSFFFVVVFDPYVERMKIHADSSWYEAFTYFGLAMPRKSHLPVLLARWQVGISDGQTIQNGIGIYRICNHLVF